MASDRLRMRAQSRRYTFVVDIRVITAVLVPLNHPIIFRLSVGRLLRIAQGHSPTSVSPICVLMFVVFVRD